MDIAWIWIQTAIIFMTSLALSLSEGIQFLYLLNEIFTMDRKHYL